MQDTMLRIIMNGYTLDYMKDTLFWRFASTTVKSKCFLIQFAAVGTAYTWS